MADTRDKTVRMKVLRRLAEARGRCVTHDALLFAMYGDRADGGPVNARNILSLMVMKLRREFGPGAICCEHAFGYALRADLAEAYLARVDDAQVVLALTPRDAAAFAALRAGLGAGVAVAA